MSRDPTERPDEEPAHDVLAAEAFAVPAADPGLRSGPVVLPEDPSGIAEPHDILAAEEFAMPAGGPPGGGRSRLAASGPAGRWATLGALAGALLALQRRRRRRR
jgi:hypothetical protein